MYKYLLFDLDNTLLDFSAAEARSLKKTFTKYNVPITNENIEDFRNINQSYWEMFERKEISKQELLVRRFSDFFNKFEGFQNINYDEVNTFYLDGLTDESEEMPHAYEVVSKLSETCKIYLVTNGISNTQDKRINNASFKKYITKIYVSEAVGIQKPEKGFFDYVLKDIGITDLSEVLLIGDSLTADIIGGIRYGIDTCWYEVINKETDLLPTYIIKDLRELLNIIK